jgi:hypothetical protein
MFNKGIFLCWIALIAGCYRQSGTTWNVAIEIKNATPVDLFLYRIFLDGRYEQELIDTAHIKSIDQIVGISHIPKNPNRKSILKLDISHHPIPIYFSAPDGTSKKNLHLDLPRLDSYRIDPESSVDVELARDYRFRYGQFIQKYRLANLLANDTESDPDSLRMQIDQIQTALDSFMIRLLYTVRQPETAIKILLELDFAQRPAKLESIIASLKSRFPSDQVIDQYITKANQYLLIIQQDLRPGDTVQNIIFNCWPAKRLALDTLQKPKLLAFWASFQPKSMESLYALKKQEPPGYQVISCSLDIDSLDFVSAVRYLPSNWLHVYDLDSWNGKLAGHFLVDKAPFYIGLDQNNKVVFVSNTWPPAPHSVE